MTAPTVERTARDLRAKALGYLRAGAVAVLAANTFEYGPRRPFRVIADVVGHKSTYRVEFHDVDDAPWSCSCRTDGCAHVAAVQMVTGHDTAARPSSTPIPARTR